MESRSIETRIKEIALKAAADCGVEFIHLEIAGTKRNQIVRIFADKEGGITIEDCSNVSKAVEAAMDADDFMPAAYVLEVSSPGLDRELYSLADFEKFVGKLAKIKMKPDFDGPKGLNGRILKIEGGEITFDDRTSGELTFPYESVAKANLKIDIEQELGRR
jgi:ribosome maturation factor RimP